MINCTRNQLLDNIYELANNINKLEKYIDYINTYTLYYKQIELKDPMNPSIMLNKIEASTYLANIIKFLIGDILSTNYNPSFKDLKYLLSYLDEFNYINLIHFIDE